MELHPNNISIIRLGQKIIPVDEAFVRKWGMRLQAGLRPTFSAKEPINPVGIGFHWIISDQGQLILLHEISRRPYTPRFLKWLANWTRITYEMHSPTSITLGTFVGLFKGNKSYIRKLVIAACEKYGPEQELTASILSDDIIGKQITYG